MYYVGNSLFQTALNAVAATVIIAISAMPANSKSLQQKVCKNHGHQGVGVDSNKTMALRIAYKTWSNQVSFHDGPSWASTKVNSGTKFSSHCGKITDPQTNKKKWECVVSARPCRIEMAIIPLNKFKPPPMLPPPGVKIPPNQNASPNRLFVPRRKLKP